MEKDARRITNHRLEPQSSPVTILQYKKYLNSH